MPKRPDHQQADFGQQRHGRREQRPDLVRLVVDGQVVRRWPRGTAATSRCSCANALTTRMPGMVSASTLVTSPHTRSIFSKPVRSRSRTTWIIQAMNGSGSSVTSASQRVDREQDRRRHRRSSARRWRSRAACSDRKTQMRSVSLPMRDDQVAGALAAEVFQRQLQQVLVGRGAQVGADALATQRQQLGARPAQRPGQQRRRRAGRPATAARSRIDALAVLERNQHVVHQRDGQVGRHQRRGGRGQRQQRSRPAAARGKAGRSAPGAAAPRSTAVGRPRRLPLRRCPLLPGDVARLQALEPRRRTPAAAPLLGQGEAPLRQPPGAVQQLQRADAGMVSDAAAPCRQPIASLPSCRRPRPAGAVRSGPAAPALKCIAASMSTSRVARTFSLLPTLVSSALRQFGPGAAAAGKMIACDGR